jgi:hypothetical protein
MAVIRLKVEIKEAFVIMANDSAKAITIDNVGKAIHLVCEKMVKQYNGDSYRVISQNNESCGIVTINGVEQIFVKARKVTDIY